jgi:hypothetical protein
MCGKQGDQIGRIFAQWAIVCFGHFFGKLQKLPPILWFFFPRLRLCIYFDKNVLGHMHFWAIFSPTHLITLGVNNDIFRPEKVLSAKIQKTKQKKPSDLKQSKTQNGV